MVKGIAICAELCRSIDKWRWSWQLEIHWGKSKQYDLGQKHWIEANANQELLSVIQGRDKMFEVKLTQNGLYEQILSHHLFIFL